MRRIWFHNAILWFLYIDFFAFENLLCLHFVRYVVGRMDRMKQERILPSNIQHFERFLYAGKFWNGSKLSNIFKQSLIL